LPKTRPTTNTPPLKLPSSSPPTRLKPIALTGYVEIQEMPLTPSSQLQGLTIQRSDEDYANSYPLPPGSIWEIGDPIRKNRCEGVPSFTYPDGVVRAATPWIKVISNGAATQVQVREWRQQYNN
jgi:hypothetical protein